MGENERIMGRLIAETKSEERKNLYIATKCKPYSFFHSGSTTAPLPTAAHGWY